MKSSPPAQPSINSAAKRFYDKVIKTKTCWLWQAYISKKGYGSFGSCGKIVRAHRYAYELEHGPIPEGLTIDHLCRIRHCVRPSHLEAVSMTLNVLRGVGPAAINARKTRCKYGHLFTEDNIYRKKNGNRACKTCSLSAATLRSKSQWTAVYAYRKQWREKNKDRVNAMACARRDKKKNTVAA